jgi:RNA recognition motif-containing protein
MLRNLPCSFTRSALLEMLDSQGFTGLYDFVYVPIDFERELCKGYAFVNMSTAEHLQRLVEVFNGYSQWPNCTSSKVCQASLSHTQGLKANIERYRDSPVMGDAVPDIFKPALFVGRRQIPFPKPTKKLPPVIQKN